MIHETCSCGATLTVKGKGRLADAEQTVAETWRTLHRHGPKPPEGETRIGYVTRIADPEGES